MLESRPFCKDRPFQNSISSTLIKICNQGMSSEVSKYRCGDRIQRTLSRSSVLVRIRDTERR